MSPTDNRIFASHIPQLFWMTHCNVLRPLTSRYPDDPRTCPAVGTFVVGNVIFLVMLGSDETHPHHFLFLAEQNVTSPMARIFGAM